MRTNQIARQLLDLRKPANPADRFDGIRRDLNAIAAYLAGEMTLPACCKSARGSEAWTERRIDALRGEIAAAGDEATAKTLRSEVLDVRNGVLGLMVLDGPQSNRGYEHAGDHDALDAIEREWATAQRDALLAELKNEPAATDAYQVALAIYAQQRDEIVSRLPVAMRGNDVASAEVMCATHLRRASKASRAKDARWQARHGI